DSELASMHKADPLLYREDERLPTSQLATGHGLFMSLDLRAAPERFVGYKAKPHGGLLDLTKSNAHEPLEFWEPVTPEAGDRLVLDPEQFYLLLSDEAIRVPPELAAEMTAYDPTSGELRTHYAGFFDPGFGHDRDRLLLGSRATLEVRAHDVAFSVGHRQRICKLSFEHMLDPPARLY